MRAVGQRRWHLGYHNRTCYFAALAPSSALQERFHPQVALLGLTFILSLYQSLGPVRWEMALVVQVHVDAFVWL
ncbi:hypothetical protein BDN71DRAFT_1090692 [Pleurotus eryngii]|uniref:Uncharacterized protein n=1 Tax=Pleurotus eryngii TaxID=5323 RepID=A0A9P5ZXG7_PLEER|nr:hypothetical protein BDN71DRAFT_1090692 [Pleurotus eryngii]